LILKGCVVVDAAAAWGGVGGNMNNSIPKNTML